MPDTPHKILVIRFSSIGDIVLTSPVVRCLKQQVPGCEVHFLTKSVFAPIVKENPNIDRVWEYTGDFGNLLPALKAERFDFIADLHKNLRSAYVRMNLRRPSGSFPKLNLRKWMAVNLKANVLPPVHIVDRYFNAVAPLKVRNDAQGLDYFIPSADEVKISVLPEPFRQGYIAFVIGGKHTTKILPKEEAARLCSFLKKPVVLLGGKEDAERASFIAANGGDTPIHNGCGVYTLNQSASLVKQSDKVITNDTGLMHIAAAFRKPVVSIWGSTVTAFGMYPYLPGEENGRSLIAEVKGLPCRPCSKIGFEKCPKGHFRCMKEQDLEAIASFLAG